MAAEEVEAAVDSCRPCQKKDPMAAEVAAPAALPPEGIILQFPSN